MINTTSPIMLLQTLQESSSHSIEDLKKLLSKDKRVKAVLQKHLELDDISSKAEFLNTLKFYVLNNRNVLQFVESRKDIKDLSSSILKKLRELKPATLTQNDVDRLLDFVSVLFREFNYVQKSGISASARKELVDWANKNGRYFDLSRSTQRELQSVPDLRPSRPIVLYRGLLFSGSDLKERKGYGGQLEVGVGLKFLRSIRDGSRIVDLEWDRASSWTTSKEVAMRFARFAPSSSNFSATMQWLSRKGKIDGDLGFVISTIAQPEDVLIDMARLATKAHLNHGDEGEFILKPGKYQCRVSTKLTKDGEVDPLESAKPDDEIQEAVQQTRAFAGTWSVPESISKDYWRPSIENVLRTVDPAVVKKFASSSMKADLLSSFEELQRFYNTYLAALDIQKLTALNDTGDRKILDWIKELSVEMTRKVKSKGLVTDENPSGEAVTNSLTPEQFRNSRYSSVTLWIKEPASGKRFTDNASAYAVTNLQNFFDIPPYKDLHRASKQVQKDEIQKVLDKMHELFNAAPTDFEEGLKFLGNFLLALDRNLSMQNFLEAQQKSLLDAVS